MLRQCRFQIEADDPFTGHVVLQRVLTNRSAPDGAGCHANAQIFAIARVRQRSPLEPF